MIPALSAQPRQAPLRLGLVYVSHGVICDSVEAHQTSAANLN